MRSSFFGLGSRPRLTTAAALLCTAASVVAASCGTADSGSSHDQIPQAHPLAQHAISVYPLGSPERALWLWFQAVQFADPRAVAALTTRAQLKPIGAKAFNYAVRSVGLSIGTPRLVSARHRRSSAAIRVLIRHAVPVTPSSPKVTPRTFYLVHSAHRWKVNDITYLLELSNTIYAQQHRSS